MSEEKKFIRIGKVSSINYDQGLIRVTYPDRDNSVTAEIPVFSFTDEYKMPQVGSEVLVLHLSNGAAAGVMMGHYWNKNNRCPKTGPNIFRKVLAHSYGESYLEYDESSRKLTIYADEILIQSGTKITIEAEQSDIHMMGNTQILMETQIGDVEVTKNVNVKQDVFGDSSGSKISLLKHKHTCPDGDTGPSHM